MVDYTTDEAVLAGLLNDHCLVVHRLPLRMERDYVLTTKFGSQFTTSESENYSYWSKPSQRRPWPAPGRNTAHLAHTGPDELPQQGLMRYLAD
ncbi:hypothetical protein SAMN04515668_4449 [Hymenobacter arizonensis]|uniref:Uncharacterized protein n=1 Tax=Hymenobacter arizonensis TaxID=1227077 RepID=A0A1I6BEV2_HYMAR|nr:hypothetical protein SAMN04515668_4449 [Hymenobacter arizonensis]